MFDRFTRPTRAFTARERLVTAPSVAARSIFMRLLRQLGGIRGNRLSEFAALQKALDHGAACEVLSRANGHTVVEYSHDPLRAVVKLRDRTSDLGVLIQVFVNQEYRPLVELISQFVEADEIRYVLDAGANIGLTTIYLRHFYPNAEFICVEPDQGNLRQLRENVSSNSMAGVHVFEGGVWGESRPMYLDRSFRDGAEWAVTLRDDQEVGTSSPSEAVEGKTVDDLIADFGFPRIDILKMDIEGGEFSVFHSDEAADNVLKMTRFAAIEIHDEAGDRKTIERHLARNGFIYYSANETTVAVNLNLVTPRTISR
jgi:FkbM family methyltransferase